ncbi:MAG: SAM-dependent methyltransferase [Verrucomicrobiaceae bacterium]
MSDLIRTRIQKAGGCLPWAEVMRLALYEPGLGYYRRGVRRIGRGGDFFTSVSVGPVFGELLAVFIKQVWRALGEPAEFAVVEQGAHDGQLACDILDALQRSNPDVFRSLRLIIIEPDALLRETQCKTLDAFTSQVVQVSSWDSLTNLPVNSVFICNELPDAMPVHLVKRTADGWTELHVQTDATDGFAFVPAPLSSKQQTEECVRLGDDFLDGQIVEINLDMLEWVRQISCSVALILDYGLPAKELFSPERINGTLRRYRGHQCDDRVLEELGECDLTSHVNFTRLAQEAGSTGFVVDEFIEQGRFLTRLGSALFSDNSSKPDAAWLRQFQTLSHPGMMGRSFHALVLAKGTDDLISTAEMRSAARRRLGL